MTRAFAKNLTARTWIGRAAVTVLSGLLMCVAIYVYSTGEAAAGPVHSPRANSPIVAGGVIRPASVATTSTLAPVLSVVPSEDGTELYIGASGIDPIGGTIFVNIGIGPGHDKGSWTMTYSNTAQAYIATAAGFTSGTGASGPLSITTTLGLDTGTVDFYRAYVPSSTIGTIDSMDGYLQLTIVSTDTFTDDTYILVVPSYSPPGPLPDGYRLVGSAYSARASGALLVANKPMLLRIYYNDILLAGADPHTLSIFAWDASAYRWENLGGQLFYTARHLSVATSRFTTYALMTTTWRVYLPVTPK